MRFMVVGINHETAPVEIRERASISDAAFDEVLQTLRESRTVMESVVVSTCNRTEFYCVVSSERAGTDYLVAQLSAVSNVDANEIRPYVYVKCGQEAIRHLFRVITGLNSLVVGETQILGQVRSAYLLASDQGNTGVLLNKLFRLAVELGKKSQSQTSIGQSPVSVSYAAVQLAKKVMGQLNSKRVLILGAGKMRELALTNIQAYGPSEITIANRTLANAERLAAQHGVSTVHWSALPNAIAQADIVFVSTSAQTYVVSHSMVSEAQRIRNFRPMVMIDMSVPRNVDPATETVRNVYQYDIDDLKGVVDANLAERRKAAIEVEQLIHLAMAEFTDWLSTQAVVPVITAIRQKGSAIESDVLESLKRKLPNLTEKEFALIHKHTMSIVNQLLRDPVLYMKEQAVSSVHARQFVAFAKMFGVEEQLSKTAGIDMMDGFTPEAAHEGGVGFGALVKAWFGAFQSEEHGSMDGDPSMDNGPVSVAK